MDEALRRLYSAGIPKDQVKGIVCHVGNKADRTELLEKAASEFGGIDILISNAAANPAFGPALDVGLLSESTGSGPNDVWTYPVL